MRYNDPSKLEAAPIRQLTKSETSKIETKSNVSKLQVLFSECGRKYFFYRENSQITNFNVFI